MEFQGYDPRDRGSRKGEGKGRGERNVSEVPGISNTDWDVGTGGRTVHSHTSRQWTPRSDQTDFLMTKLLQSLRGGSPRSITLSYTPLVRSPVTPPVGLVTTVGDNHRVPQARRRINRGSWGWVADLGRSRRTKRSDLPGPGAPACNTGVSDVRDHSRELPDYQPRRPSRKVPVSTRDPLLHGVLLRSLG